MAVGFFVAVCLDGTRIRAKQYSGGSGTTGAGVACAGRSTGKACRRIGIGESPAGRGGNTSRCGTHADGAAGKSVRLSAQFEHRGLQRLHICGDRSEGNSKRIQRRSIHSSSQFQPFAPRSAFMGEFSLTARTDAGTGTPPATGFNAEVERSIIRFEHNDYFKVSFGRYHTPINYWNTAFHHGQWLQTTVSRPEMTQFGGKFIPVHFVGALVEGATPAGGLNFNYNFGVGNGRGNVISRAGDAGDNNNARAWLVNMFVRPDRFYGLQVGGSAYRDKDQHRRRAVQRVDYLRPFCLDPGNAGNHCGVRQCTSRKPDHRPRRSPTARRTTFRRPIASRCWTKRWKPYYRFEYIHVPKSDTAVSAHPRISPDRRPACATTSPTLPLSSSNTGISGERRASHTSTAASFRPALRSEGEAMTR